MILYFTECELITADRLNELVDALNNWEFLIDFPIPGFNGVILDGDDNAGADYGQFRSWRYLVKHRSDNNFLHVCFKWTKAALSDESDPTPRAAVFLYDGVEHTLWEHTAVIGPSTELQNLSFDLSTYTLGPGEEYIVRVYSKRAHSKEFKLFWVFEADQ